MSNPIKGVIPPGLYAFPSSLAFPDGNGGTNWAACPGMTLRDWFAGQALAANGDNAREDVATVARNCYALADAMLAVREGK